jgi:hypothetical protein
MGVCVGTNQYASGPVTTNYWIGALCDQSELAGRIYSIYKAGSFIRTETSVFFEAW